MTRSSSRKASSARSIHIQRRKVLSGAKGATAGGLKKSQLKENKKGIVVSREKSDAAKKQYKGSPIQKYNMAVKEAKKKLGIRKGDPFEDHVVRGELKSTADKLFKAKSAAPRRSSRRRR